MHCPPDWYQSFFTGIALDLWRTAVTPELTRTEADTIQRLLDVPSPARLLDVPCGNGRLTIEMASRGYTMTGVDIAGESIDEGKRNAAQAGVHVELRQGDMRQLTGLGTFAGVYCWGNSFGYLEDEGNVAFLSSVASVLEPGGRFVLEFGTLAETILPHLEDRIWYQVGDILFAIANSYDVLGSRLLTEYTFVRDGVVDKRMGSQQVWTMRELKALLNKAGFDHVEALSYGEGKPLQLRDQRAVIVARKGA
jgi:SAM-dependent methyltransferase